MFPCLYLHVSMFPQTKSRTNGNVDFRLFPANRKRRRKTFISLLQMEAENRSLFSFVSKRLKIIDDSCFSFRLRDPVTWYSALSVSMTNYSICCDRFWDSLLSFNLLSRFFLAMLCTSVIFYNGSIMLFFDLINPLSFLALCSVVLYSVKRYCSNTLAVLWYRYWIFSFFLLKSSMFTGCITCHIRSLWDSERRGKSNRVWLHAGPPRGDVEKLLQVSAGEQEPEG
jgi:hypothetical protein